VRIVDIGDFSRELCGGTHVGHGSQAGPVRILGESSIGTSLRRIEALTGLDALSHYDHERHLLTELATLLDVRPDQTPASLRRTLDRLATAQAELDRLRQIEREQQATRLAAQARPIGNGWLVTQQLLDVPPEDLRPLAIATLTRMPDRPAAVILALDTNGKAQLVAAISEHLAANGAQARDLLTDAATLIGGGAGGRGNLASAGGRDAGQLARALDRADHAARTALTRSGIPARLTGLRET